MVASSTPRGRGLLARGSRVLLGLLLRRSPARRALDDFRSAARFLLRDLLAGLHPARPIRLRCRGGGRRAEIDVHAEHRRQVLRREHPPSGRLAFRRGLADGLAHHFRRIHAAQREQHLGLVVEPRAHAVEHGGDVLAHRRPVRTRAIEGDLSRHREQTLSGFGDGAHHGVGDPSLQELDHRVDPSGAMRSDALPPRRGERLHPEIHLVDLGPAHERRDAALGDLQIKHRSVSDVGPSPRQAVRVIAVRFQVVAPRDAPEGRGDPPAFDRNGRELAARPPKPGDLLRRLPASLRNRNVRAPAGAAHRSDSERSRGMADWVVTSPPRCADPETRTRAARRRSSR